MGGVSNHHEGVPNIGYRMELCVVFCLALEKFLHDIENDLFVLIYQRDAGLNIGIA